MKTKTVNSKGHLKGLYIALSVILMLLSTVTFAQDNDTERTLLRRDIILTDVVSPELKFNSIQGETGTLVGVYGGPMINNSLLIGACGGVNLGHPRVNYGYLGGIIQYVYRPEDIVHYSIQLVVASGTTKDYENPKSGLLDNFWNISGASFLMIEPGINLEVNITKHMKLVVGASYRYVSGINPDREEISYTHVSNDDMSGLNFTLGLKFCKPKNNK